MPVSAPSPHPWWLWPNLLALDAPLVAVVWQRFLAGRAGVAVPWLATLTLALVVWSVYLADRWLDAKRGELDADRHRFADRFSVVFVGCSGTSVAAALVLASQLPCSYISPGIAVGIGVAAYLLLIHAMTGGLRTTWGAKELLVSLGFASGLAIPSVAAGVPATDWLPGAVAFAGLCWLNCRLISQWECPNPTPNRLNLMVPVTLLLAMSLVLPLAVGVAVAAALLGLVLVNRIGTSRPRVARILADAVLLTPILAGLVL